jgi:hypothetical protein
MILHLHECNDKINSFASEEMNKREHMKRSLLIFQFHQTNLFDWKFGKVFF